MLRGLHVARRCVATTTAHRCFSQAAKQQMRKSGYVVKRLAVAPQAVATIRRNALAQAREPPAPAWRKWLGLEKNLKEGVDGGPHGRLLIPLAPDDDGVAAVLTKALAAIGEDAVADAGLTSKALLVELSVLAVLPRAAAQPPHLDVLPRDGLSMATLFVPLQDVSESNGATVLYPAPPSSVAARRDWALLHKSEKRTYAPDGSDDHRDAASIQAEAAGLLPPVASPWAKCSPSELGLGAPVCLELRTGDVALMDYRCFHRGGANVSEDLRCVLYATFSSEGDHHSYSVEASKQTRRLGEFLAVAEDRSVY
ncbi:unnamed protein product [Pelagomonas calceolata]|uniref:Phytanoyl-CoA dioxygenase n=1 Tax=Pelagomonas calceolata TaxID=35677 RepID=A0A8J2X176_9STRA|nr:unnamed protein product [Pelagomonas calceolata]